MAAVQQMLPARLRKAGPTTFVDLWPALLCEHHLTLTVTDLGRSATWYQAVLNIEKAADRVGDGWTRVLLRSSSGRQTCTKTRS